MNQNKAEVSTATCFNKKDQIDLELKRVELKQKIQTINYERVEKQNSINKTILENQKISAELSNLNDPNLAIRKDISSLIFAASSYVFDENQTGISESPKIKPLLDEEQQVELSNLLMKKLRKL